MPGARCLGADAARLAVQRCTPPHLHASHAAPVARSHLFVPKCVADACEFTAKMLPQFANGRDTFKGGLYPSETTCDEASINHPYFDLKLPKGVAMGKINDVPFDDDGREYGGLKSMTIASGTHCHVACKSNALGVDAKKNPIPSA